jgi:hypothetical protein
MKVLWLMYHLIQEEWLSMLICLQYGKGAMTGDSLVSTPQNVQAPKRQKKVLNGLKIDDMMGSATSSEEDRREQ